MKKKTIILIALVLTLAAVIVAPQWLRSIERTAHYLKLYGDTLTFQQRVDEARRYTESHDLNTQYVILVDFNKPSGDKNRFRVYDLNNRTVILNSICMHGAGKGSTASKPTFSNQIGSNSSCLGKFHTAGRHTTGKLGGYKTPSYDLVGKSGRANNNAQRRGILIHGWAKQAGKHLPLNKDISSGCFAIESAKVRTLGQIIEQSEKPILLWAYHKP